MARAGRPRKPGKRKPCGRLRDAEAREQRLDVRHVVMAQPHRAWLKDGQQRDQRAETQVGRLLLAGRISEPKYWAAERWRSVVREFHVVLATPVQTGSSLSGMVSSSHGDVAGDVGAAERPETDEEKRDRVLMQHGRAMSALRALPGSRQVFAVMERVVIRDHACPDAEIAVLEQGLSALCGLWRMPDPPPGQEAPVKVAAVRQERPLWTKEAKTVIYIHEPD